MCLHIDKKFNSIAEANEFMDKPKIAKKDIIVFKALENDFIYRPSVKFVSPYRYEEYKTGELKTAPKFTYFVDTVILRDNKFVRVLIDCGIHSYKTIKSAKEGTLDVFSTCFAIESIIPKGTPYFENDDEYVSLALQMPNEFIKIRK